MNPTPANIGLLEWLDAVRAFTISTLICAFALGYAFRWAQAQSQSTNTPVLVWLRRTFRPAAIFRWLRIEFTAREAGRLAYEARKLNLWLDAQEEEQEDKLANQIRQMSRSPRSPRRP